MIEAPDFNAIKEHPTNRRDALCCIVFAPKFHRPGYEGILSRCEYLNARSREYIHFYCAGYGAYWNEEYAPDMEPLPISKEIPWCFSQLFLQALLMIWNKKPNGDMEEEQS